MIELRNLGFLIDVLFRVHGRGNSKTIFSEVEELARKERFGSQHGRSYYLGMSRTMKQRLKPKDLSE